MFNKKLLLLHNAVENSYVSTRRSKYIPTGGGTTHDGSILLENIFSLGNRGNLILSGNTTGNISVLLSVAGSRTIGAQSILSSDIDLLSSGSKRISGDSTLLSELFLSSSGSHTISGASTFTSSYDIIAIPALTISGTNVGSIVILLNSNGELAGQAEGATNLNTVFSLFPTGTLQISAESTLLNSYILGSTPSLRISGAIGPGVVFDLAGDGSTATARLGDLALLISSLLFADGRLSIGGSSVLTNNYSLMSDGRRSIGGIAELLNEYSLDSKLAGVLAGQFTGSLNLDITGSLTALNESIRTISFLLHILQTKNMTLNLQQSKTFTLKL